MLLHLFVRKLVSGVYATMSGPNVRRRAVERRLPVFVELREFSIGRKGNRPETEFATAHQLFPNLVRKFVDNAKG
jgi:hypothetical protein